MRTRTSPALGPSSPTSTTSSGALIAGHTAALGIGKLLLDGRVIVMRGSHAPVPVFARRGPHAVGQNDRNREDDARHGEARDRHPDRPRREGGRGADEERDDRDAQREIADTLAERGETGDPFAPRDDGIVRYQAIHPCAANVSSIAPGRSASENEMRARLTFASK